MLNNKRLINNILILFILIIGGCSEGKENMTINEKKYKSISEVPEEVWETLSKKKIYFGHQSVGFNIIDGIKDIMIENPKINLNIIETSNLDNVEGGCFAHSRIGENTNPKSKIDDFNSKIENGIGNKADIAFFKFCYVDIVKDTDLDSIIKLYNEKMDKLIKTYPNTKFIHVTVPLNSKPKEPDTIIKKIKEHIKSFIGNGRFENGISKYIYNEKLRSDYTKDDKILFDLADSESTDQMGNKYSIMKDDKKIQFLNEDYTFDGGHLNEKGRKKIAEDFLLFLVHLL